MKTFMDTQGSAEWLARRLGVITASEIDALVTPKFKARTGEGVETYLYRKVCEQTLGFAVESGSSFAMENGSILEGEAIPYYSFTHDVQIDRVGFCTTDGGRSGCSPDGLIGEEGGIEIKCPAPHTHLKYLLQGKLPDEYAGQVHFSMYVTGRKWWKFMSYSRQFPPLILHVERDEEIQVLIHSAVTAFIVRLDEALVKIQTLKEANGQPAKPVMNDR